MKPLDAPVVVVGAGPAGLAAARAIAERDAGPVVVIDRDDAPGGLPRFCRHPGFGWEYSHRLENGQHFARRLVDALDTSRVAIATQTSAVAIRPGPEIDIVNPEYGHLRLRPRAVVLATGIRERPRSARLVPGRRPERGIMTTGQLQQFVARGIAHGGRRAVVIGTEHVAFSILLTARHAGIDILAMVGAEDRVMSYRAAGWAARILGVPVHLAATIEDIAGSARVEAVTFRNAAGLHTIACDTVIFSGDFVPDAALLPASGIEIDPHTSGPAIDQHGRTNARGIFAAGNLLRAVESSGWAANEGACVGANVAAFLAASDDWRHSPVRIRAGAGLDYAVPQFWAPAPGMTALPVSLRASEDFTRARLGLDIDGAARWTGGAAALLRKRRIAVGADAFESLSAGPSYEATFAVR
ncbi:MAG: FAD-dependent oxidoreductase [Proteobacteria bacterium]|nr:FAD-dependent oxidoreductase [Pseudomonadota bacterium]